MPAANSSVVLSGPLLFVHDLLRPLPIELHATAQEALLVQPPQQQVRVGNGGHGSAAKTDWTRVRAGRLRSHTQHAAGIEAGNGSASGAGSVNVEHRHAYRNAGHGGFAGERRTRGIRKENVGRCTTHVKSNNAFETGPASHLAGADHTAGGTRQHGPHGLRRSAPGREDASRRLHHIDAAPCVMGGHALLQMQQIALHPRGQVGVDDDGRSALIFAKLGQDAVRGGDGKSETLQGGFYPFFCLRLSK